MLDNTQLAALKSHMDVDASGRGYASMEPGVAANSLNLRRAENQVFRGVIPSYEIINVTASAIPGLTSDQRQTFIALTGAGNVDADNGDVRSAFAALFTGNNTVITALQAVAKRDAADAELLLGRDVVVRHQDVTAARALP